ncbi:hypothetical protein J7T55_000812 [Diaporthe amygdali]|uniref:uncharacterized protein n=1 Tax=Phomopsis amygdali TaxID=1214568 RepID=UPI0022FEA305|nr:uncharacterized protein J7T55_000812 [Diaporthe amygdali]KAJ0119962.1 hypothetical protein J7T55_000812 [Diaporthe amygdali]
MASTQKAIIISGFACIGKSSLGGQSGIYKGYKVVDLDSSGFTADPKTKVKRTPAEFVKYYIAQILKLATQKIILMVSTHQEIRDEMCKRGLKYTLVYPSAACKAAWLGRLEKRAGKDGLYNIFNKNWAVFVGGLDTGYETEKKKGAKRQVLNKDQYLVHVIDNVMKNA